MSRLRAAIYARHSIDRQNPRSNDDQGADCRALIARIGADFVETYTDREISGCRRDRPGMTRLLRDVEAGRIEVVVCKSLDRIARDDEDISRMGKTLSPLHVRLFTSQAATEPLATGIAFAPKIGR